MAPSCFAFLALADNVASHPEPSRAAVTKPILGFVALLILAYIAGRPRLAELEKKLALNPLATTGLVFVLLGMLAASGHVGILTDSVIRAIGPIVPLGLGWLGFRVGLNYERRLLANPPSALSLMSATLVPIILMMGGTALLMVLTNPKAFSDPTALRDVLLVGTAGAMTSLASVPVILKDRQAAGRLEDFVRLEQVVGTTLLMLIAVYFRPHGEVVAWQLPPIGWLLVTLGAGSLMGILAYWLLRDAPPGPPFIVLLLGLVAMTAGLASFLRLAVIPVCAIAGTVVSELPGAWKEQVRSVLVHMERPVFFVLLVVAGALWRPLEWQGWALMVVLVISRWAGKSLAAWLIGRREPDVLGAEERKGLVLAPIGTFAIAIVITARDLYPGARVPWMLTAAIGGAIVSEIVLQVRKRSLPGTE
jgi:hypothetical protein